MSTSKAILSSTIRGPLTRGLAALALGLGALLTTSGAAASQDFPSEVQEALDMPCPPPCTLCHTTQVGQAGTAVKPFLLALRTTGLMAMPPAVVAAGDGAALEAALKVAQAVKMDSDMDMVPDTDELTQGLDPNTNGGDARICGPAYGCGARISPVPPATRTALGLTTGMVLLLALALRRRR